MRRSMRVPLMVMVMLLALDVEREIYRAVEGVGGEGCQRDDMRKVKREVGECLPQFYEPARYAIAQEESCCVNASARCCHGLRAALPIGDSCMCGFVMQAWRKTQQQGLPFSIDVPSALLLLSSQCQVDFGYSPGDRCGRFYIP